LAKRLRFISAIVSNKELNENMKYDCIAYVQESFLAMLDNLECQFFFETQAIVFHKVQHWIMTTTKSKT
jgi:hypothetical protein